MSGSPPKIGDAGREWCRMAGKRRKGLVIPEVAEEFQVSVLCARRYVLRLVREGVLRRTEARRRRYDIFGRAVGPGGFVYRAPDRSRAPAGKWAHSRSWSRRRRAR